MLLNITGFSLFFFFLLNFIHIWVLTILQILLFVLLTFYAGAQLFFFFFFLGSWGFTKGKKVLFVVCGQL